MKASPTVNVLLVVTPNFNLAATVNFLDPFRAANYLDGTSHFEWTLASTHGGHCVASNGMSSDTLPLASVLDRHWDFVVVSASWAPETNYSPTHLKSLCQLARQGSTMGALDTGAFILAKAGLLKGRRVTVHYEHIDAFRELFANTTVVDELFVFDGNRISCSGGVAAVDFSLHIIQGVLGAAMANHAAIYLYQQSIRPIGTRQIPEPVDRPGRAVPKPVSKAIKVMESHLENVITIPEICRTIDISQRQLDRLFASYVKKTPALYYRDIRLDRSRGLVTQTDMPLSGVAVASGFVSQVHFSRAYKQRFGLPPGQDRIEGRIPFEYRARPLHKNKH